MARPAGKQTEAAMALMKKMAAAYAQAPAYHDEGEVSIRFTIDGQSGRKNIAPFAVAFERPNKIAVRCYTGTMLSDGQTMVGWVDGLSHQVWKQAAPEKLTSADVYADPLLGNVLATGLAGGNPHVLLLLDPDPLPSMLEGSDPPDLDTPDKIDDRLCYRVRVSNEAADVFYWIDQQTLQLRRVEMFPKGDYRNGLGGDGREQNLHVALDFNGRFAPPPSSDVYTAELPEGSIVMRRLLPIAPPEPPEPLLGRKMPDFTFTRPDGSTVKPADLQGKITVLDFWATWCQPCRQSLPLFDAARKKYADNPNVQFWPVSIDQQDVTNEQVQQTLTQLGVEAPPLRALDAATVEQLGVKAIPCLLLVGADGVVQNVKMGIDPKLDVVLAEQIDAVRAGKNLFVAATAGYEQAMADYLANLKDGSVEAEAQGDEGRIAPASPPQRLKMTKLWSITELDSPGNLLVVPGAKPDESPRVWVNDGWRGAAEIDLEGKVAARHPLELGDDDVTTFLRTTVGKDGARVFAASAQGQQRLTVFDAGFKRLWQHPTGEHAGLSDVQLGDLNGDGEWELAAGYFGQVGLHIVSAANERRGVNRSVEDVSSVYLIPAVGNQPGRVLCTNQNGGVLVVDAEAQSLAEWSVAPPSGIPSGRFLRLIRGGDLNGDGLPELCGVALTQGRTEVVVGVGPQGQELWTYRLPAGHFRTPIEPLASGRVPGHDSGLWVAAGPDGSLHFLSRTGELLDRLNLGAALTGLALVPQPHRTLLLVSSRSLDEKYSLDAYDVSFPSTEPAKVDPAKAETPAKVEEPAKPETPAKPEPAKPEPTTPELPKLEAPAKPEPAKPETPATPEAPKSDAPKPDDAKPETPKPDDSGPSLIGPTLP